MATTPPEDPDWEVVEVVGRLRGASNATLYAHLGDGTPVVYKPILGEAPLWDFPRGSLAIREVLAHLVADAAGWEVVPETRWSTGPHGPGSVQRFVTEDLTFDPRDLVHPAIDHRLWSIACLDVVTNNADRKLGHVLVDHEGGLWAIDNALTFHPDPKLRTVLWGFAGAPVPAATLAGVHRLAAGIEGVATPVAAWLGAEEAEALATRIADLAASPLHPDPPDDRPPLPWPVW